MRNFFGFFVLLIFAGALLIFITDTDEEPGNTLSYRPCEAPLTYRIGDVDSRYNISKQQLTAIMDEVEELWETALDRDLLNHVEDGKIAINLIYSKEQKRSEEERLFARQIETKKEQAEATRNEYRQLTKRYKEKEDDLKSTVEQHNRLAESYKELAGEIQGQNPSSDRKEKLAELELQVSSLKSDIEKKQTNLESLRKQTNARSDQLNNLVKEQNRMIQRYNKKFGGVKRFDQGQFIREGKSEAIKVLQFSNHSELKTVLAHEIGHALGLDHVKNPKAVMYHKIEQQNIFDLQLSDEDISAIQERCRKQN